MLVNDELMSSHLSGNHQLFMLLVSFAFMLHVFWYDLVMCM